MQFLRWTKLPVTEFFCKVHLAELGDGCSSNFFRGSESDIIAVKLRISLIRIQQKEKKSIFPGRLLWDNFGNETLPSKDGETFRLIKSGTVSSDVPLTRISPLHVVIVKTGPSSQTGPWRDDEIKIFVMFSANRLKQIHGFVGCKLNRVPNLNVYPLLTWKSFCWY